MEVEPDLKPDDGDEPMALQDQWMFDFDFSSYDYMLDAAGKIVPWIVECVSTKGYVAEDEVRDFLRQHSPLLSEAQMDFFWTRVAFRAQKNKMTKRFSHGAVLYRYNVDEYYLGTFLLSGKRVNDAARFFRVTHPVIFAIMHSFCNQGHVRCLTDSSLKNRWELVSVERSHKYALFQRIHTKRMERWKNHNRLVSGSFGPEVSELPEK